MNVEKTLSIIKPDSIFKNIVGEILRRFETSGFKISELKMLNLEKKQAKIFYFQHKDKFFFKKLIDFMISGPIIAVVLECFNVIKKNRELIGHTNPLNALTGTIRSDYGSNITENAIHGSDSINSSNIEIQFFFGSGKFC